MFLDEGIKSVRMDDIATRLGVSKRTLYEMFGDKRDLLEQSLLFHFEEKRRSMMEHTRQAQNVIDEIFIILSMMKQGERDALLVENLKKFYPDIFEKFENQVYCFSREQFNRLLERGISEGLFLPNMNKELAIITLSYTMAALFDGKSHNFAPLKNDISMRMAFEYVVVYFFRGLATKKGIETIDEIVCNHRKRNG